MNERLKEFIQYLPTIKKMTGVDAAICVWNKEATVEAFCASDALPDLYFEKGYQTPDKTDKMYDVLRTGVETYNKIPKEVFGVAIEGTITPIMDGREVVGVVTYVFSTEEKEMVLSNTEELANSISNTDKSIEGIVTGTKDLASNMGEVQKITDMVRKQVDEANHVVEAIQKNAKYSNILALNASIESARAGQAGKGFSVVADEMRKFSEMSSDSAIKINENLNEIIKSLDEVRDNINHSSKIADEQANAANQLSNMFDFVSETAHKVSNACKKQVII